jgi:antitoxin HicB
MKNIRTKTVKYPAKFKKEGSWYNISFPDFSEAITCAEGLNNAILMAEDCLETAILHRITNKETIPAPSVPKKGYKEICVDPITNSKLFLYWEMQSQGIKKADLARKLDCNQKQIDRLLDVSHRSTIGQLETALFALGKRLIVSIEDARI